MKVICDNCGKEIGMDVNSQIKKIGDEDNFYNKLKQKLKEEKLKKIKSRIKRFFTSVYVEMPVDYDLYHDSLDFCDKICYKEWKKKLNDAISESSEVKNG